MLLVIILGLLVILLISFFLAYRSLSELEIPVQVLDQLKKGKPVSKFWGVIIFLKKGTIHYSSSSLSPPSSFASKDEVSTSLSINSSKSSERMEE